jgi:predicted dehydrogenase
LRDIESMSATKVRVALVGCGQIADAHLREIRKNARAELVGVCDQHLDLAKQASARFGAPPVFTDFKELVAVARPDVLHITTPPHTHRSIALQALAAGLHVYIEKPFMIDAAEATEVLAAAEERGRLVCVGHDQLFDPAWEECRRLHRRGDLGRVVHVDSVLGYDLAGPFGRVLATESDHWIHRLPGGLFQNVISHPLYRVTDFLTDTQPEVWATWFSGDANPGFATELRVLLRGKEVTANLIFTSAARPVQRLVRIYGTREGIEVDLDGCFVRRYRTSRLPGAFAKLEVPFRATSEGWRSLWANVRRFLRNELNYFAGMGRLFELFYRSILGGGGPPIPYAEIVRVTAIMDEVFRSCRARTADSEMNEDGWSRVRPNATLVGSS